MKRAISVLVCLSMILATGCSRQETIRFGAAGVGGMYYPFANAYTELMSEEEKGINWKVKSTAGSAANLRLLSDNYIELGIAQADLIDEAYYGKGTFHSGKYSGYKAVASLYPEACQIVVRKDSGIDSPDDLEVGHPGAVPGLHLTGGDRLQRRPDGLGTVGALVDGKYQNGGGERVNDDAQTRQPIEDHKELYQQRSAADDPDVKAGNLLEPLNVCKLHQGGGHCNNEGQREGNDCQRDGHSQARQQDFAEGVRQDAPQSFVDHFEKMASFFWCAGVLIRLC